MAQAWEFFEHTADIGVIIYGATLPELFANGARAMYEALGELQQTGVLSQKSVELKAESLEDLLHDWLTELLYEIETNHVLYNEMIIEVVTDRLMGSLQGAVIDFERSLTNEEIKAVTYHHLRVESLADGSWRATVIFDV